MTINDVNDVIVTGYGWELPGFDSDCFLDYDIAYQNVNQFDPKLKLGKKGIRYKDHATLLSLCAAKSTLANAKLDDAMLQQIDSTKIGVIASSNLSNLDTVVSVVKQIRTGHVNDTSAMDLPNASSNVLSTSIAIRFGLKGINMTLCNGISSGLDALLMASNAIKAGRAERMLVIGVEVNNPVTTEFLSGCSNTIFNGAIGIMVESKSAGEKRGAVNYGTIDRFNEMSSTTEEECYDAILTSGHSSEGNPLQCPKIDISKAVGESYGAEGIIMLLTALELGRKKSQHRFLLRNGLRLGDLKSTTMEFIRAK